MNNVYDFQFYKKHKKNRRILTRRDKKIECIDSMISVIETTQDKIIDLIYEKEFGRSKKGDVLRVAVDDLINMSDQVFEILLIRRKAVLEDKNEALDELDDTY